MTHSHRRHDISDEVWALLETHLPGRQGVWGGIARDNRQSSMLFSGLCAQAHRGGICRRITGIGAIRTAALSAGATRASGKDYWKP